MNFKDCKKGDVCLFKKNNSFISKAIALVTTSSRTHAGIIYGFSKGFVCCAEAQSNGFTLINYSNKEFNNLLGNKILLRRSKQKLYAVQRTINKYLGRPYDYKDLIFILLNKITGKFFPDTSKKLICSEAVARVLYDSSRKKIDFEKEFKKPFSYVTPDDLNQSNQLVDV